MAVDYSERIKDIEFINMFPSMNSSDHVFLMTAITDKGNRVLVYAPMVKLGGAQINTYSENEYDWRCTLYEISHRRHCQFMTEMFSVKSTNAGGSEFFKIVYLDGVFTKHIKKEEIEKLFGCEIDG